MPGDCGLDSGWPAGGGQRERELTLQLPRNTNKPINVPYDAGSEDCNGASKGDKGPGFFKSRMWDVKGGASVLEGPQPLGWVSGSEPLWSHSS